MARIRGSITRLAKKHGYGFILEDGCEVYFEKADLKGIDIHSMSVSGCNTAFGLALGRRPSTSPPPSE